MNKSLWAEYIFHNLCP